MLRTIGGHTIVINNEAWFPAGQNGACIRKCTLPFTQCRDVNNSDSDNGGPAAVVHIVCTKLNAFCNTDYHFADATY